VSRRVRLLKTSRPILYQSMMEKAGNKVGHIAVSERLISRHYQTKEGVDLLKRLTLSIFIYL